MKVISRFFSLPSSERILLLRLTWYIVRAEIVLSFLPYSKMRVLVFKQIPLRRSPPSKPLDTLRSHLKILNKLCRTLPWSITCLRQAVALRDSLAAEGVEAILKIGMCRNQGGFAAHAWLDCCNQEVLKNGTYCELTSINGGLSCGE